MNIFIMAVIEILCQNMHAQQLHYDEKLDSIISTDTYKKEKFALSYDGNGRVSQVLRYRWVDDWTPYEKSLYVYDEEGRNVRLEVFSSTNGTWKKGYKLQGFYDSSGKLVEETLSLAENAEWAPFTKDEYVYGTEGKCAETKHYLYSEGKWGLDSKWERTYDGKGFLIRNVCYKKEGDRWEELYRNEHEYDDRGNETLDALYVKSGDGWSGHYRFGRTYNDENRMTSETRYNWTPDKVWKKGSTVRVHRDALGNESGRDTFSAYQNRLLAREVLEYDVEHLSANIAGMDTGHLLRRYEWASPVNMLNKYAYKLLSRQTVDAQGNCQEGWTLYYSKE